MLERLTLWVIQGHLLAVEGGFFSTNWHKLVADLTEKRFFDVLMNPFVIALSVIILIMGILFRRKGFIMVLVASWGYSTVYHFTIEGKGSGDVAFDWKTVQVSEFGTLVWFFGGFILVTAVLLYLGFVKGD